MAAGQGNQSASPELRVERARGFMKHVRATIEELRRYILHCEDHDSLQEVDTLLDVALQEVRRKLAERERRETGQAPPST